MHMLYQRFKVIEGMELSKAIWYSTSGTFSAYYEFIIYFGWYIWLYFYGYRLKEAEKQKIFFLKKKKLKKIMIEVAHCY